MSDQINTVANISLWLVEDNRHFQQTMFSLINESDGFECAFAFDSCEEALEKLKNAAPPEVILLDIGLKGMNGIEGVKKFKEITPATHIIMLTIQDDSNTVFEALCAGASGYLLKDSSPERVIESVKEVIAGGVSMNAHIAKKIVDMFKQLNPPKGNYRLTEREKEILSFLVTGLSKKQIADKLFISFHTVNTHIKNIYEKLHVNTRAGVISKAFKEKLV